MELKHTPLFEIYRDTAGVQLAEFHGWELPIHFASGIIPEHHGVRTSAGLFDVSHMGEILVDGEQAEGYLQQLLTTSVTAIKSGEICYTLMCYQNGGVVDDLMVYKISDTRYLLVVNAGNIDKDVDWIMRDNPIAQSGAPMPDIRNQSDAWAQLALQGPKSEELLAQLVPEVRDIPFFTFRDDLLLQDMPLLISRSGYTGEDGFEIYLNAEDAPDMWRLLAELPGVQPCGLGARDTLRLEAKLPLYGHEISESITPLEANLGTFVDLDKHYFVGREALVKQQQGIPRSLRGVEMIDSGFPRDGYRVVLDGRDIGYVTSGTKSPTLGSFIALVLIDRGTGLKFGDELHIDIRGKLKAARLVRTPFYKKQTGRN